MRTPLSILVVLGSLAVPCLAAAQPTEPRLPTVGLGGNVAFAGSEFGASGGFGLGGTISLLTTRPSWPGLVRAEIGHHRFMGLGENCPTIAGSGGTCGETGLTLTGGTLGMVTPLTIGTRPLASVAIGAFLNEREGTSSLDAALSLGVGIGSLERGRAAAVELRPMVLWGQKGYTVLLPFSATFYR